MMSSNGFAFMNNQGTDESEQDYVFSKYEQEILKMNSIKQQNLMNYNPEVEDSEMYNAHKETEKDQSKFSF